MRPLGSRCAECSVKFSVRSGVCEQEEFSVVSIVSVAEKFFSWREDQWVVVP
jgi:hypothetical protein